MTHKLWIDGAWADTKGGGELKVENPATGEIVDVVEPHQVVVGAPKSTRNSAWTGSTS